MSADSASTNPIPSGATGSLPASAGTSGDRGNTGGQAASATTPRRRWQAPDADGAVLSQPPLSDGIELAARNAAALTAIDINIQGQSWQALRSLAREQALAAAREYTKNISPFSSWGRGAGGEGRSERFTDPTPQTPLPSGERGVSDAQASALLFVTGHQPALFHPGVWVKNFAIGRLATHAADGVALNLIVDNDVMTSASTSVRVPSGTRDAPRFDSIALDDPRPAQPWEEATVLNRDLFRSFSDRVADATRPWGFEPLVGELWPAATRELDRSHSLTDCLTAARHDLEQRWGVNNLELPLSRLCETDAFRWFACHVLANLPRFRDVYNSALAEYRRVNHVRSQSHPVPVLTARDEWLEAPFRVWRRGDTQRHRVFARQVDRELHLSDGRDIFARLSISPDCDATAAVAALRELPLQGIRFRMRALTTTLFARLFLADLFVHGIGGAKYDEMTDRIITEFYRVPVPEFLTLTATARLPLRPFDVTVADRQRLQQRLRNLEFHGEQFVLPEEQSLEFWMLTEFKRKLVGFQTWLANHADESGHRAHSIQRWNGERHREMLWVNQNLAGLVAGLRDHTANDLGVVNNRLAANRILASREFSYCLFPAEKLRDLMNGITV